MNATPAKGRLSAYHSPAAMLAEMPAATTVPYAMARAVKPLSVMVERRVVRRGHQPRGDAEPCQPGRTLERLGVLSGDFQRLLQEPRVLYQGRA